MTTRRAEPAPPFAALELHRDQIVAGVRTVQRTRALARDKFETAANWELRAITGLIVHAQGLARVGRAFLVGRSPRTRRGRWRRDLVYLEMVEAEAVATLSGSRSEKYAEMVAEWRKREPLGIVGRYKALRNRQRQQARNGGTPG